MVRLRVRVLVRSAPARVCVEAWKKTRRRERPCTSSRRLYPTEGECEILDQLRLEITYQYAINHIDPYEGRNNIVHAQESGYLPIRIGGRVRLP